MLKLPSLTELFFGKGVDPATYIGENKAPAYLTGKGKKQNKSTEKAITAEKPVKKKPIKEVQTKAPKNAKTAEKPRGTNKDLKSQEMLKKFKVKKQYMTDRLEKTVKELLEEIEQLTKRIKKLEKTVAFHEAIRRR